VKFCYFDESGMGEEPYLVMAGLVADAARMHITKDDWAELLETLTRAVGSTVREFHTCEFYAGNGIWRDLDGVRRARVIEAILAWVEGRKHNCVFAGIDKAAYSSQRASDPRLGECGSAWCLAALHCVLQVQKQHQCLEGSKGHSVLVFDREITQEQDLTQLVFRPPEWLHSYYRRDRRQQPFSSIVDVPFFADSKHILLAQVADLFAYVLRTWAELVALRRQERYSGELATMHGWVGRIAAVAYPRSSRYPARGRCSCTQLLYDLAPAPLRTLG